MKEGKLYHDTEIKDEMAAARPFGDWVGKIKDLDVELSQVEEKPLFSGDRTAPSSNRGWLHH